jgi:hypothetical protein
MSLRRFEQQAIARVEKKGVLQGTAFLIGKTYAITARHVVRSIADDEVDLVFSDPALTIGAIVVHPPLAMRAPGKGPDWALLQLKAASSRRPLRLQRSWQSNQWVSYGFGDFYVEGKSLPGGPLSGEIVGNQLQCKQLDDKIATDAKGFSGAPVIISRAVVGLVSQARKNTTSKKIKGGLTSLDVGQMLADWPAGHERPDERQLVLIAALTAALKGKDTSGLVGRLGLTGFVGEVDIAEGLVELSYDDARAALKNLKLAKDQELTNLLDILWVHADAGAQLHATLSGNKPVAAIRTGLETTVRHHLMRAHGVARDGEIVTWGDERHMIKINMASTEALDELIQDCARNTYNGLGEPLPEDEPVLRSLADSDREPAIFTITGKLSDTDIDVVAQRCKELGVSRIPSIVAYGPTMSPEHLATQKLTADLIQPFPNETHEQRLAAVEKQKADQKVAEREARKKP